MARTKTLPTHTGNGDGAALLDAPVSSRAAKSAAHLNGLETRAAPTATGKIVLPQLDIRTLQIVLVGDSELICHKWSQKAKQQMLDKQMGVASAGKEHKNPVEDYKQTLYQLDESDATEPFERRAFGFPSIGFKGAAVTACTSLGKSITKVAARQAFHVLGELARVHGTPRMREDMVKLNGQTADIRHRGGFVEWAVRLDVKYNARVLSNEQIVNLFNTAGFAVGVGEWRSERDGGFGLFHVATGADGPRLKRLGLSV